MRKQLLFLAMTGSIFCACNNDTTGNKPKADLLASNLDTTVKPGDDFFLYANGGWIKRTPIPGSESGWGIGNMVQDEIYNRLKKINDDAAAAKNADGSIAQKIGDFWKTAMDSTKLNKEGVEPILLYFDQVNAVKTPAELLMLAAALKIKGVDGFFGDYVAQDDKNSDMMAYKMDQGGLGMPNRDYYFNTDQRTLKVRTAYKKYLFTICTALSKGDTVTAHKKATAVYDLETRLAKASRKLEDLRDPYKNYNKMNWDGLSKIAPSIDWKTYAKNIGADKVDSVIIGQPEFYTALSDEI
jgi:putative endopeptidase